MKRLTPYLAFFAAAAMTAPAFCAGVTLINQSTVLTSGGFPYIISQSGSYQLSSNLIVPCGTELTGISITASYVTLDLDGFTLSCQTTPNAATGIVVTGTGVTIMNGMVTGFGAARRLSNNPPSGWAISIQIANAIGTDKIDHVRLDQNGNGLTESGSSIEITDSSITNCLGQAIASYGILRLSNSSFYNNSGGGIAMNNGVLTGNVMLGNGAYAIQVGTSANITNNHIAENIVGVECTTAGITVGLGMNAFSLNTTDTTGSCNSMKNNISSVGQLF